jgi:hypothetical protein
MNKYCQTHVYLVINIHTQATMSLSANVVSYRLEKFKSYLNCIAIQFLFTNVLSQLPSGEEHK